MMDYLPFSGHHRLLSWFFQPGADLRLFGRGKSVKHNLKKCRLYRKNGMVTLEVEVVNRIGHSTLPVGNEGGTAFFGSDNAGSRRWKPARPASRCGAVNLPNFDFPQLRTHYPPGASVHHPGSLHCGCLPWRLRWMRTLDYKINRLETDLPALRS